MTMLGAADGRGAVAVQRKVLALDDPENDRLSSATTRMSGFLR